MGFKDFSRCIKGECYLFILCSAILFWIVSFASEDIFIVKAKDNPVAQKVYTYTQPDASFEETEKQEDAASLPTAIADHPAQ